MNLLSFYLGLDLGQSADYSALCVLEESVWVDESWRTQVPPFRAGWVAPAEIRSEDIDYALEKILEHGRPQHPPLAVRHLERFPLGTPYPEILERVRVLLDTPPLTDKPACLLVDKGGVGAAVVDSFLHAGLNALAITIHGGSTVTKDTQRLGFRVPKRDLVSAVQVPLQNKRLRVARGLPEAETLRRELENFRVKIDARTAHDSYEHWRENDHDDLVLAVAMACWFQGFWNAKLEESLRQESA